MTLTLRIEYSDGSTTDLPADTLSVTRALDEQDRAEMQVPRDDWTSAAPATPRTAKLYALVNGAREFGGRLDDVKTDGGTATVRINSPEIDAAEAEPTGENVVYQNVGDDAIVTDQVQAVPTLSTGTITQQASAISYSVSHGSRSKVLYDLRKATGSEFRYNADWTVDYVGRLGSDKSGSVTLGPAAGNIGDDFQKTEDVRENVTHVKALGAQSGPSQITATAAAPSYSSGRKIWKRYENKEVQEQSRLQSIADELVAEYDGEPRALTVECTVYPAQIDADLQLGDSVFVDYPEEDINRALRITNITFEWAGRGFVALLTLSNRALTDEDRETKRNDDLQRFNRGYQGFDDRDTDTTIGRQPVTATLNANGHYRYPDDVVTERRAEILVEGLPYRAYSAGAANNPPLNAVETRDAGFDLGQISDADGWVNFDSFDPPAIADGAEALIVEYIVEIQGNSTAASDHRIRLSFDYGADGYYPRQSGQLVEQAGGDLAGDWYGGLVETGSWYIAGDKSALAQIEAQLQTSGTLEYRATVRYYFIGTHIHPPDPGVVETFDGTTYYPKNVDVVVNGSSAGVSLGDGSSTFQEIVDISGMLDPGFNEVEVTSETKGHVRGVTATELFRRGPKSN